MNKEKATLSIPISNFYEMMTYVYPDLANETIKENTRAFTSLDELLATMLIEGMQRQIKRGLYKTYVPHEEASIKVRGKIDMRQSIRLKMQMSNQLYCKYDVFDKNNLYNQILKAVALFILRKGRVGQETRRHLQHLLKLFYEVSEIRLETVTWEDIRFHKDKITYRNLIGLCHLIYKGIGEDADTQQTYMQAVAMGEMYSRFVEQFYLKECSDLKLSYQNPSLVGVQQKSDRSEGSRRTNMVLESKEGVCLLNHHYDPDFMNASTCSHRNERIAECLQELIAGMANYHGKVSYGVFLYPSAEENYLEMYPVQVGSFYLGAINLCLPFSQIREELLRIPRLDSQSST